MSVGLTQEQRAKALELRAQHKPHAEIAKVLGVKRKFVAYALRRGRVALEPSVAANEATRIAAETLLLRSTVYRRLQVNAKALREGKPVKDVRRPVPRLKALQTRLKALRRMEKLPPGFQYGAPRTKPSLTESQREMVRVLRASHLFLDHVIAVQFQCEIRDVLAIEPFKGLKGNLTRYVVGDELLTIPEIASQAGTTRAAIYERLKRGVRGLALLTAAHKGKRKVRRDKLTDEMRELRRDTLAAPRGAPADETNFPGWSGERD